MKTALFPIFFLSFFCSAQNNDSLHLVSRLDVYMDLTRTKDFNKLMDYLHPSLFKLSSRDELMKALTDAYSSEEIELTFDTMRIVSISEEFLLNNSKYRRVDYFASMRMRFLEAEETDDSTLVSILIPALKAEFTDHDVTFDKKTRAFIIRGNDLLLAIKDPATEWMFLGYEKGNPMIESLFPKEVVKRFRIQ